MHASVSAKKTAERISALEAEVAELEAALGEGEDAEKIVSGHIKLLHQYNEAKDATQILLGKLATLKQTTVKHMHGEYGLSAED